jgi:hypothetical protein
MTAAAILALLDSLLQAAPEVMALFQKAQSGQPVSATDVQTALGNYGIAHTTLDADIKKAGG